MQNKFVTLISRIKEHPVAFLERKSLQLLRIYIDGYLYSMRQEEIDCGESKERKIYTIEETEKFFKALATAPLKYRVFFTLVTYTGMHRGEMLGLEWKDINFENGVIHIQRTSNYTKARGIYTDTTKTKRSQRTLKILPFIMNILQELKDEQDNEALRLGDKWVETDRLFVKWNSKPMNNQTPYGWLKKFCEKNGLPFYGIQSSRHFAASSFISAGLYVTTVSGALGHSNINITKSHFNQISQIRQQIPIPMVSYGINGYEF